MHKKLAWVNLQVIIIAKLNYNLCQITLLIKRKKGINYIV